MVVSRISLSLVSVFQASIYSVSLPALNVLSLCFRSFIRKGRIVQNKLTSSFAELIVVCKLVIVDSPSFCCICSHDLSCGLKKACSHCCISCVHCLVPVHLES